MTPSTEAALSQLRGLRLAAWPTVTLSEVAREMGRSKSYISLLERGKRPLSDAEARRYLEALAKCRERAKARFAAA